MATTCPECKNDLVQSLAGDNFQCLACYTHFDGEGNVVETSNDRGPVNTPDGYDHTGPYPTPTYPTDPDPDTTTLSMDGPQPAIDDKSDKAKASSKTSARAK